MEGIRIVGLGKCLPDKIMTNDDFAAIVDTNDEWITTRTGIKERHFCNGQKNYMLAANAAADAINDAKISKEQISCLITATFTPDYATPSVACLVQKELGLPKSMACMDVNAACSGFLYGLQLMRGMLAQEQERRGCAGGKNEPVYGLLIGSEVISSCIDMTDRGTCILFGDGAGAAVVQLDAQAPFYGMAGSDGNYEVLNCSGEENQNAYIHMNGSEVFRFAVGTIPKCVDNLLEQAKVSIEDVDYVVCHQANARIIDYVRKLYKAPENKFFMNLARYGNTSAASIPIALCEMKERGMLTPGTTTVCVGFGAGLTWAGVYLKW